MSTEAGFSVEKDRITQMQIAGKCTTHGIICRVAFIRTAHICDNIVPGNAIVPRNGNITSIVICFTVVFVPEINQTAGLIGVNDSQFKGREVTQRVWVHCVSNDCKGSRISRIEEAFLRLPDLSGVLRKREDRDVWRRILECDILPNADSISVIYRYNRLAFA